MFIKGWLRFIPRCRGLFVCDCHGVTVIFHPVFMVLGTGTMLGKSAVLMLMLMLDTFFATRCLMDDADNQTSM